MKVAASSLLITLSIFILISCEAEKNQTVQPKSQTSDKISSVEENASQDNLSMLKQQELPLNPENPANEKTQIIFVELGSVKCIPCKKMQPVMKAIEKKYGDQIKVIFYDVWTDEGRPYAKTYDIRLIPTQVFLNREGSEILRHEGFFPEEEIDKFLQSQGLKPMGPNLHD